MNIPGEKIWQPQKAVPFVRALGINTVALIYPAVQHESFQIGAIIPVLQALNPQPDYRSGQCADALLGSLNSQLPILAVVESTRKIYEKSALDAYDNAAVSISTELKDAVVPVLLISDNAHTESTKSTIPPTGPEALVQEAAHRNILPIRFSTPEELQTQFRKIVDSILLGKLPKV